MQSCEWWVHFPISTQWCLQPPLQSVFLMLLFGPLHLTFYLHSIQTCCLKKYNKLLSKDKKYSLISRSVKCDIYFSTCIQYTQVHCMPKHFVYLWRLTNAWHCLETLRRNSSMVANVWYPISFSSAFRWAEIWEVESFWMTAWWDCGSKPSIIRIQP